MEGGIKPANNDSCIWKESKHELSQTPAVSRNSTRRDSEWQVRSVWFMKCESIPGAN